MAGAESGEEVKPDGPNFDRAWRAACEVIRIRRSDLNPLIERHYLGKWPGVCVLTLALRRADSFFDVFLGVIVFALPPRETAKRYGGYTWELARLWVDESVPRNGESWFIAQAVRYVREHHKSVMFLVSYADPAAGHSGTIYRAANWTADGCTDQERKTPRFDYADAATGKRYSRRSHVPQGIEITRIPRVSKSRFVYRLHKDTASFRYTQSKGSDATS